MVRSIQPADTRLSRYLSRIVRPHLKLWRWSVPLFQVCGYTGLMAAWILALTLIAHAHRPLWPMAVVAVSAMAAFVVLTLVTRIVTGVTRLVYYHHEIAIILTAALVLRLLGRPVLPYLDATILGVGGFLAFGRIGCFMAGCCHGRPSHHGVRYRRAHADNGFPSSFIGVRIFPVQLVESFLVFVIVAIGAALVWTDHPSGTAFVWYVVAYDGARFCLEFIRGDRRPDHGGFSSPQWISVILTIAIVIAGWLDLLPPQPWQIGVAISLAGMMLLVWLARRFRTGDLHRLRHPHQIRELADALADLDHVAPLGGPIAVATTSRGLRVSRGASHYTISAQPRALTPRTAQVAAELILALTPSAIGVDVQAGGHGTFHILVRRSPTRWR